MEEVIADLEKMVKEYMGFENLREKIDAIIFKCGSVSKKGKNN